MGIFNESYSSIELAEILGVHRVTVTNWIRKGALHASQTPGGRYKVSKADLKRFLADNGLPAPVSLRFDNKKLVVAVDDDEGILSFLKRFFTKGEMPFLYELKTFPDPLDATLFIRDAKPEIVLLDLCMPRLSGLSLAERIKETSPGTRVIVITGYATRENIVRMAACRVDGVLTKPVDLNALKELMEGRPVKKGLPGDQTGYQAGLRSGEFIRRSCK